MSLPTIFTRRLLPLTPRCCHASPCQVRTLFRPRVNSACRNPLQCRWLSTPASAISTSNATSTNAAASQHPSQSPATPLPHPIPSSPSFTSASSPTPLPPPPSPPTPPSTTSSSPPPPRPSGSSSGPITWKSLALMIVAAGGLLAFYNYEKERKQTAFQPVVSIGRAALGAPFSLVSHTGDTVTSDQLKGNYAMIYFGFTHCPDICPVELQKMEKALAAYHTHYPNHPIQPVFISIDPHRDTPQRLQQYKQQYSPSFLFLTGSAEQIQQVARGYRVYYSAPDLPAAAAATGSEGAEGAEGGEGVDDYLVDHSIFFYLLDRDGEVMDYYGKNMTWDEIVKKLCQIIPADNKQQPAVRK